MPEPAVLLPATLGGLATGGVYALLAAALALVHGKLKLIDFNHALGLLLAAFGLTFLLLDFGFDPVRSLPFAAGLAWVGGNALQRARAADRSGDPLFAWIVLLVVGAFGLLQAGAAEVSPGKAASVPFVPGFVFDPARALALFAGLLGCGLLAQAIERTDFGRRIRAAAQDAPVPDIEVRAFGIACAFLAMGACLLVPSNGVQVQAAGGFLPVVLALAVLGARGRLRDALAGGLLVGLVESVGRAWLGDGNGLLLVAAVALAMLLGHTGRLFATRVQLSGGFQKR